MKYLHKNIFTAIGLAAIIAVSSCTTKKTGTLKNPNVYNGQTGTGSDKDKESDKNKENKEDTKKIVEANNIALLLPFQLNRVANKTVVEEDVKRSALALDFYQGFQLGVNSVNKNQGNFKVNVIDSEDSELKTVAIAASKEVTDASLIVGPIYPKEIRSFAKANQNKKVLQVNPLAATMPTEFNISNLVSITPPIRVHLKTIVDALSKKFKTGDVVIVFDARDNDHRQFIAGFDEELKLKIPNVNIIHVAAVTQIEQLIPDLGNAHIVCGTTEKTQLRSFITKLDNLAGQGHGIKLYGHPLWDRINFNPYNNFYRMDPTITSESHLKAWSTEVQQFQNEYKKQFKVSPSDYSYKGYDAGRYFVGLLNKYGADYAEKLVDEKFTGVYSDYLFTYNPQWGYVNQVVKLKSYRNGSFQ